MNYNKSIFSSEYFSYLLLVITVFLSGLGWPIGRFIVNDQLVQYRPTIPPFMIVLFRYIIFVTLLFAVTYIIEKDLRFELYKKHWKEFYIMSLISITFYQFGHLYVERLTAASDASLVFATSPIIVLFVAAALVKESNTPLKILGSVIAFLGIAFIVGFSPNTSVPNRYLGDALVFFSAICYGTYIVLLRRLFNAYYLSFVCIFGVIFFGITFRLYAFLAG